MRNIVAFSITLPWQRPRLQQLPRTASAPEIPSPEIVAHRDVYARAEQLFKRPKDAKRHLSSFLAAHPEEAPQVARFWRRHGKPYEAVAVLDNALTEDMLTVFEARGASRSEAKQQSLDFRKAVAEEIGAALGTDVSAS